MKILSVILAVLLGSAVHAQTYECDMVNKGNGGWIGDKMYFTLVPEEPSGAVYDWAVHSVHKAPLPARVVKRSDTKWKFFWVVNGVQSANGGKLGLNYNATLDVKRSDVTVRANLSGFDNQISGRGECKIVKR